MKKKNKKSRAGKWPALLVALAILMFAGFGFAAISENLSDVATAQQTPQPTEIPELPKETAASSGDSLAQSSPTPTEAFDLETKQAETSPTIVPTPSPAPTPDPTPTPEPLPFAGLKIGIDPGHQLHGNSAQEPVSPGSKETKAKVSSGTSGVVTRIAEHVTDLEIALQLRDQLQALGAEVLMTRETADVDISNVERAVMMNEWGADLVLRIHCNGVNSKSANGIGLYVRKTGAMAEESYEAAEAIMPRMLQATGARQDGIFKRDIYSGLNWSEVPSILVENGYMSNPEEDVLLNDTAYQAKLARGMAEGIADYFGRDLSGAAWPEPETDELSKQEIEAIFEDYQE